MHLPLKHNMYIILITYTAIGIKHQSINQTILITYLKIKRNILQQI
jgi:hypothetical protein